MDSFLCGEQEVVRAQLCHLRKAEVHQCPQAVFLQCSHMPVPLAAHCVVRDKVLIVFVDCIIGQVHADVTLAGNHKRHLFTLNH